MKAVQSGFGIIEVLLIVVTIGLIGALGWIAYDRYVDQVDEDKLFNAHLKSNTDRAIEYRQGDNVNQAALSDLVRQAIDLNHTKTS